MEILKGLHVVKLKKCQFLHGVKNSACRILTKKAQPEILHRVKMRLHSVKNLSPRREVENNFRKDEEIDQ
jgi:hypothetical protein